MPAILALQAAYQAGSPLNLQAANPSYVQPGLAGCTTPGAPCSFPTGNSMFNPDYKSPRSVQMNIGIQRELHRGMVLSVDFARNVQTHYLLGVDQNHAGDINYFNLAGAQQAIAATLNSLRCYLDDGASPIAQRLQRASLLQARRSGRLWAISRRTAWVLRTDLGGSSCLAALGHPCAFGGINPNAPPIDLLSPVGRSTYDGLQMKWTYNTKSPIKGTTGLNFTASYSLSSFQNTGGGVNPGKPVTAASGDQDFVIPALNNSNVNAYFGPSTLDRTHQISFGGYLDIHYGFQLGLIGHFDSPFSTTLTVPNTATGAGEIFRTDFDGRRDYAGSDAGNPCRKL